MDCSTRRPTVHSCMHPAMTAVQVSILECSIGCISLLLLKSSALIAIVVTTAQHGGLQSAMQRLCNSPGPRSKSTDHTMQAAAYDWHCSSPYVKT